jgi:hypothetical protein|tara:strand:+ start:3594 stop:3914 length:321 start_codon:yes stop_codon:yes gene_type:complete
MTDVRIRAYNIERRYRTLSKPWLEIIHDLRSERGALLGSSEYQDLVGIEKAMGLNNLDTRLKEAEAWLNHYESERADSNKKLGLFRSRKLLKEIALLSDDELEGKV